MLFRFATSTVRGLPGNFPFGGAGLDPKNEEDPLGGYDTIVNV